MRATGVLDGDDVEGAAAEVSAALEAWSVRGGAARVWVRSGAAQLGGSAGEWVLEHDDGLVSFEVFAAGRRVFGIDDWLG